MEIPVSLFLFVLLFIPAPYQFKMLGVNFFLSIPAIRKPVERQNLHRLFRTPMLNIGKAPEPVEGPFLGCVVSTGSTT